MYQYNHTQLVQSQGMFMCTLFSLLKPGTETKHSVLYVFLNQAHMTNQAHKPGILHFTKI